MKKTLVDYHVAFRAKENGFDWECRDVYEGDSKSDIYQKTNDLYDLAHLSGHWKDRYLVNPYFIPAPYKSDLEEWFREVHNISVWTQPDVNNGGFFIGYIGRAVLFSNTNPIRNSASPNSEYIKASRNAFMCAFDILEWIKENNNK